MPVSRGGPEAEAGRRRRLLAAHEASVRRSNATRRAASPDATAADLALDATTLLRAKSPPRKSQRTQVVPRASRKPAVPRLARRAAGSSGKSSRIKGRGKVNRAHEVVSRRPPVPVLGTTRRSRTLQQDAATSGSTGAGAGAARRSEAERKSLRSFMRTKRQERRHEAEEQRQAARGREARQLQQLRVLADRRRTHTNGRPQTSSSSHRRSLGSSENSSVGGNNRRPHSSGGGSRGSARGLLVSRERLWARGEEGRRASHDLEDGLALDHEAFLGQFASTEGPAASLDASTLRGIKVAADKVARLMVEQARQRLGAALPAPNSGPPDDQGEAAHARLRRVQRDAAAAQARIEQLRRTQASKLLGGRQHSFEKRASSDAPAGQSLAPEPLAGVGRLSEAATTARRADMSDEDETTSAVPSELSDIEDDADGPRVQLLREPKGRPPTAAEAVQMLKDDADRIAEQMLRQAIAQDPLLCADAATREQVDKTTRAAARAAAADREAVGNRLIGAAPRRLAFGSDLAAYASRKSPYGVIDLVAKRRVAQQQQQQQEQQQEQQQSRHPSKDALEPADQQRAEPATAESRHEQTYSDDDFEDDFEAEAGASEGSEERSATRESHAAPSKPKHQVPLHELPRNDVSELVDAILERANGALDAQDGDASDSEPTPVPKRTSPPSVTEESEEKGGSDAGGGRWDRLLLQVPQEDKRPILDTQTPRSAATSPGKGERPATAATTATGTHAASARESEDRERLSPASLRKKLMLSVDLLETFEHVNMHLSELEHSQALALAQQETVAAVQKMDAERRSAAEVAQAAAIEQANQDYLEQQTQHIRAQLALQSEEGAKAASARMRQLEEQLLESRKRESAVQTSKASMRDAGTEPSSAALADSASGTAVLRQSPFSAEADDAAVNIHRRLFHDDDIDAAGRGEEDEEDEEDNYNTDFTESGRETARSLALSAEVASIAESYLSHSASQLSEPPSEVEEEQLEGGLGRSDADSGADEIDEEEELDAEDEEDYDEAYSSFGGQTGDPIDTVVQSRNAEFLNANFQEDEAEDEAKEVYEEGDNASGDDEYSVSDGKDRKRRIREVIPAESLVREESDASSAMPDDDDAAEGSFRLFTKKLLRKYEQDVAVRKKHENELLLMRERALREKTREQLKWLKHQKRLMLHMIRERGAAQAQAGSLSPRSKDTCMPTQRDIEASHEQEKKRIETMYKMNKASIESERASLNERMYKDELGIRRHKALLRRMRREAQHFRESQKAASLSDLPTRALLLGLDTNLNLEAFSPSALGLLETSGSEELGPRKAAAQRSPVSLEYSSEDDGEDEAAADELVRQGDPRPTRPGADSDDGRDVDNDDKEEEEEEEEEEVYTDVEGETVGSEGAPEVVEESDASVAEESSAAPEVQVVESSDDEEEETGLGSPGAAVSVGSVSDMTGALSVATGAELGRPSTKSQTTYADSYDEDTFEHSLGDTRETGGLNEDKNEEDHGSGQDAPPGLSPVASDGARAQESSLSSRDLDLQRSIDERMGKIHELKKVLAGKGAELERLRRKHDLRESHKQHKQMEQQLEAEIESVDREIATLRESLAGTAAMAASDSEEHQDAVQLADDTAWREAASFADDLDDSAVQLEDGEEQPQSQNAHADRPDGGGVVPVAMPVQQSPLSPAATFSDAGEDLAEDSEVAGMIATLASDSFGSDIEEPSTTATPVGGRKEPEPAAADRELWEMEAYRANADKKMRLADDITAMLLPELLQQCLGASGQPAAAAQQVAPPPPPPMDRPELPVPEPEGADQERTLGAQGPEVDESGPAVAELDEEDVGEVEVEMLEDGEEDGVDGEADEAELEQRLVDQDEEGFFDWSEYTEAFVASLFALIREKGGEAMLREWKEAVARQKGEEEAGDPDDTSDALDVSLYLELEGRKAGHPEFLHITDKLLFDMVNIALREVLLGSSKRESGRVPPWMREPYREALRSRLPVPPLDELERVVTARVLRWDALESGPSVLPVLEGTVPEDVSTARLWSMDPFERMEHVVCMEVHDSEAEWLHFEREEWEVIFEVADEILSDLMIETAQHVQAVYTARQRSMASSG